MFLIAITGLNQRTPLGGAYEEFGFSSLTTAVIRKYLAFLYLW